MRAPLLSVIMLVAACGGSSEKDYGDPVTVDSSTKSGITSAINSAAALASIESDPNSNATLSTVSGLYTALGVLYPACAAHVNKPAFDPAIILDARDAMTKPVDQACVTVTTNKVTYNACNYGSGTINGSVSYGAGVFSMDLKISVSAGGSTYTVTEKGTITVSSSAIVGDMEIKVDTNAGGASVKATYSAEYAVTLTSNCATGGFIEVSVSGSASTQGGSGSYSISTKAEFGPTCGDVKLYCAK